MAGLRRQITELVARNAVGMVQNAIDAVNEGGQYQALKYLFEIIGLFPASANEDDLEEQSLAAILLRHLGIEHDTEEANVEKSPSAHPVE
jgi:hypothetical protein